MPSKNPLLQMQEQLNELKEEIAKLKTRQRNIDSLVLRDGVSAPTAVSGLAFIYVDTSDGDLKIRYGDNVTKVIVADT